MTGELKDLRSFHLVSPWNLYHLVKKKWRRSAHDEVHVDLGLGGAFDFHRLIDHSDPPLHFIEVRLVHEITLVEDDAICKGNLGRSENKLLPDLIWLLFAIIGIYRLLLSDAISCYE